MLFPVRLHLSFHQYYRPFDIKCLGNCNPYTVLFFTYVSTWQWCKPNVPVDYQGFLSALNQFGNQAKKNLRDLQSIYVEDSKINYTKILDEEIALLNNNSPSYYADNLANLCQLICNKQKNFTQPTFCFLHFRDDTQSFLGIDLVAHVIGIYLASPQQLHIFDANNGLYVFDLPDNINKTDLQETIVDLVFNKNLLSKILINARSKKMEFFMEESVPRVDLDTDQQNIKNFIINPNNQIGCKFTQDKKIQEFIDRAF